MTRTKIIDQLKVFKKEVRKEMPDARLILFGSRAWGKPHKDSDIDLMVVSSTFRKKRTLNRGTNLYKLWNLDYPVDFLCYSPEEFEKLGNRITLVREAIEKGTEI